MWFGISRKIILINHVHIDQRVVPRAQFVFFVILYTSQQCKCRHAHTVVTVIDVHFLIDTVKNQIFTKHHIVLVSFSLFHVGYPSSTLSIGYRYNSYLAIVVVSPVIPTVEDDFILHQRVRARRGRALLAQMLSDICQIIWRG